MKHMQKPLHARFWHPEAIERMYNALRHPRQSRQLDTPRDARRR